MNAEFNFVLSSQFTKFSAPDISSIWTEIVLDWKSSCQIATESKFECGFLFGIFEFKSSCELLDEIWRWTINFIELGRKLKLQIIYFDSMGAFVLLRTDPVQGKLVVFKSTPLQLFSVWECWKLKSGEIFTIFLSRLFITK